MATGKLKFKLELFATFWDKAPNIEILVGNKVHFSDQIIGSEDEPTVIQFEQQLESGKHDLEIKMSGKTDPQTVVNEKGEIVKDQLLHIKNIEIDEIDIGSLVFEGVYTPEYPKLWYGQQIKAGKTPQESYKNVKIMGYNGSWKFGFESPFYMWLLENLY